MVAIEQASFIPTSNAGISPAAPVYIPNALKRPIGDTLGDIINVKNFGAIGDNSNDDTAAIQAALDAAFSSANKITGPVSGTKVNPTRSVFFPGGNYVIKRPLKVEDVAGGTIFGEGRLVTNIRNDGSNSCVFTGYIDNGAGGAGTTLNISSVTSGAIAIGQTITGLTDINGSNKVVTVNTVITGGSGSTWTVSISQLAGSVGSPLNMSADAGVLLLNGWGFGRISDISLCPAMGGVGLDWDWNGTSLQSSQQCFFENLYVISIDGSHLGAIGVRTGYSQAQCDTSTFTHLFVGGMTKSGFEVCNLNSINHSIVGGEFQGNNNSIVVSSGSIGSIVGCNFQTSTGYDISINGGAWDCTLVSGCSTESLHFFLISTGAATAALIACSQRNQTAGAIFCNNGNSVVSIIGCWSNGGEVRGNTGTYAIMNSAFELANPFANMSGALTYNYPIIASAGAIVGAVTAFADLPANPKEGMEVNITNQLGSGGGNTSPPIFGQTAAAGSGATAFDAKLRYNGTNWTVCGA